MVITDFSCVIHPTELLKPTLKLCLVDSDGHFLILHDQQQQQQFAFSL
jgi:hypothetical protein